MDPLTLYSTSKMCLDSPLIRLFADVVSCSTSGLYVNVNPTLVCDVFQDRLAHRRPADIAQTDDQRGGCHLRGVVLVVVVVNVTRSH